MRLNKVSLALMIAAKRNRIFDFVRRGSCRHFYILLLFILTLRISTGSTANLSYLLVALYALRGREQALQALFLSWLLSMLNAAFAPEASFAALGRYAILFSAALSIFLRRRSESTSKPSELVIVCTGILGGLIILHSLFYSAMPDVSVLKAVSWTLGMVTLLAGWAGLSPEGRLNMGQLVFSVLLLIMIASVAASPFSAAYIAGVGLKGVLGHTQSLGITMALLGSWATMRAFSMPRPSWGLISVVPLSMGLILLSGTRTAALAFILGVATVLVVSGREVGRNLGAVLPGLRSGRLQLAIFAAVLGMVAAWSRLSEASGAFLSKNTASVSVIHAYEVSRGGLIDAMWENIERNPFAGIGFGIASRPELMDVTRDPIFNLPISAVVEKGVLPLAVVEEVGAVVGFAVLLWLLLLYARCARRGLPALAVFFVAIFVNAGEAILFSSGGMGMLAMFLLAWGATGSTARQLRVNR